ncbi:T-lymphocyte surface antigen Ly-9-like [Cololabis saira]|uniref:T-lymphocyte surface antigen Ly-9-like n=1 Tax=Cololabis saira TaxID=129043 RepID=UPI002AD555A4|nr:T-lymphocyte surface antigen Ly-9-like [Cololabis saira]
METKIRIIFFHFVMVVSAAEDVKNNLTGVVGGNITLPGSVLEKGFLLFGSMIIAQVYKSGFEIEEEIYRNNLDWNNTTGLFTVTDLQRNNSGIYTIESKRPPVFVLRYTLTVYDSAETPAVIRLNVTSDSCSLLCSVDKETTLSWYKDDQMVNQSSSASSLTLIVHKQDAKSSFRCVSASPAEEKSLQVHVSTSCWTDDTGDHSRRYWIIIAVIVCFIIVSSVLCLVMKYFQQKKKTPRHTQGGSECEDSALEYSVIQHSNSRSQDVEAVDHCNITVYDKLEVHHMNLT